MKMPKKKHLKGVIALTVLGFVLITVENFIGDISSWDVSTVLLVGAAVGILLWFLEAAGRLVASRLSLVAPDKRAGPPDLADGN